MHSVEVEGYRYCVALRIVSLPLYHTTSRSYPQTESGGPGLFHSWLWQRNGARGPLLLLIRADAWLSCMPAAQPNRDYVPGWWRQKKKVIVEIFVSLQPLASLGLFIYFCDFVLMKFAQVTDTTNKWNPAHNTRHIAASQSCHKSSALLVTVLQCRSLFHLFLRVAGRL